MMRIFESPSCNAAVNAGLEEWLFRTLPAGASAMMLYVNDPAVLVGRSQNPWSECDTSFCRGEGIGIVRRISGGGAVYHDGGNLNVSLVVPKSAYSPDGFASFLLACLGECGLPDLSMDSHHSLFVEGRKVCGTASAVGGGHVLHHGCVLVSSDLGMLRRVLSVPASRRVTGGFGIPSRVSEVTRLAEYVGDDILPDDLAECVRMMAEERFGGIEGAMLDAGAPGVEAYVSKFQSDEWTFGRTGAFSIEESLPWGAFSGDVRDGVVAAASVDGKDAPALVGRELQELV